MCLSRIKKEEVLSKDLKVFRLVMASVRGLVSPYRAYPVDAGHNEVVERDYIQCEDGRVYCAGFHCFMKRKHAEFEAIKFTTAFSPHSVLPGIIPAGTNVIVGEEAILYNTGRKLIPEVLRVPIIVTPALFHKEEDCTKLRNMLIEGASQ